MRTSTDPAAKAVKSRTNSTGRSWSGGPTVDADAHAMYLAPVDRDLDRRAEAVALPPAWAAPRSIVGPDVGDDQSVRSRVAGGQAGLASRQMLHGALLVGQKRRLHQGQVHPAQRGQVPAGTGVCRVPEASSGGIDTHSQRLHLMIGPGKGQPERSDRRFVPLGDVVPQQGAVVSDAPRQVSADLRARRPEPRHARSTTCTPRRSPRCRSNGRGGRG